MLPKRTSPALLVVAAAALLRCSGATLPAVVGVPEEAARSADFALPLQAADAERIVAFCLNAGRLPGRSFDPADLDPASVKRVRETYAALFAALTAAAPSDADLRTGSGTVARLFDRATWALAVHDARVGRDADGALVELDGGLVRGFVKGELVFAFYKRRLRAVPLAPGPDGTPPAGAGYVLDPETPGRFTGLVVFHRRFVPGGGVE